MCKIKQATVLSFFFFGAFATFLIYLLYPNAENDIEAYRQIFAFSKKENDLTSTQQVREGVHKFHIDGGDSTRRSVMVACEHSVLELHPKKGLGQAVETMDGIAAVWSSNEPKPINYQLNAKTAVFYPKDSHLIMRKVAAAPQPRSLSVPNSLEVIEAGAAEYDGEVLFLTNNVKARFETAEIQAKRAKVIPEKVDQKTEVSRILLEDDVFVKSLVEASPFSITSSQLEWDLKTNIIKGRASPEQVCIEDPTSLIYGDQLTAYLKKEDGALSPQRINLFGNVKIHKYTTSGDQYALADSIDYNPITHEWELSAFAPRRVLYYDKHNSITISAPKVLVKQETGNAKPHVKALGDVRFVFAEQEFAELMNRFQASKGKKQ